MSDLLQQAINRAYANGCYLIEIRVGGRNKLLLTTKNGHRLRSFALSDVGGVMEYLDKRAKQAEQAGKE